MSQAANTQSIVPDGFCITRRAVDMRADGATRLVHVSARSVIIERSVGGVRMRVGVPVAAYDRLVIEARLPSGQATLMLRHDDPDLEVTLGCGEAMDVARSAKAWATVLGKEIDIAEAYVAVGTAFARRTRRTASKRRSRFLGRRKTGSAARMTRSFAREHEIIARD